jgi:hypothetical protein
MDSECILFYTVDYFLSLIAQQEKQAVDVKRLVYVSANIVCRSLLLSTMYESFLLSARFVSEDLKPAGARALAISLQSCSCISQLE